MPLHEGATATRDAELAASLERAVSQAVSDPPASIRVAAEGICQLSGPKPGCYCGKGLWSRCHAVELYGDHATAAILALRQAGVIPRQAGPSPLDAARALAAARANGVRAIALAVNAETSQPE